MSAVDPAAAPYRVLARKYRPASFDDLIGQEPMVRTLTNAFETGRIAQAWMLTGVRGVGKTTTARILARALNYETAEIHEPTIHMREPGIHDKAIMEGRHVDVVEMDAASHTGIDDIREIIAQVRYRPVSARYKVYIIDEVHMLSNQAFNGLLKTLEEPPEHVKFVFATTEIRKVPITVLSRCQRFDLRRVDAAKLILHLKRICEAEAVPAEDDALRLIARAAEGSVRDALSLTDQAIAHGAGTVGAEAVRDMLGLADRGRVIDLFEHLMAGDAAKALAELRDQYEGGADPVVVLADLADFTHLVTSFRFVPGAAEDPTLAPAESQRGLDLSKRLSVRTLSQVWQMLLKAIEEARGASAPRQAAEMAMIRIAHAADLPAPADLLRALRGGDDLPAIPAAPNGGGSASGPTAERPSATLLSAPPRLSIASNGGGEARAQSRAPQPSPVQAEPQAPRYDSIEALVALSEEKRDSRMRAYLRRYIRPVRIEDGRLEFALTDEAPRTLPGDLQRKLHEWTGRRWTVSISNEPGRPTLEEAETARRTALVTDAALDPEVAAILQLFPGSRVVDVRLRGEAAAAEAAEIAVEAGLPEAQAPADPPPEDDDDEA
ncbi:MULTISPECIES: DNA polymerase III subunit gamma/tau [unclassified Aureimonas]|uniref:DNA polymerase III subunit gamma/tau n=1 Tax=unclassified Aureimonas TaxID=2615206 RepID=UPI0006FF609C|nr:MULTISPECIES: DNA polymerase III subunit gamma/tau [unclassified Aureimonas]KQT53878.1 DNA polymerase III subunit gamma/tau [Aureimonas sp. Leaf427]KQT71680.1 DNA polymerase III subunit gamma/tau [Aureimonas sp. Leaf460]